MSTSDHQQHRVDDRVRVMTAWLATRFRRALSIGVVLAGGLAVVGCTSALPSREPLNLFDAKQAVIAYAETGGYERDLRMVSEQAKAWIRTRAAKATPNERLAVVFDVDETVISNLSHMREMDFGYVVIPWNDWVRQADGPALAPVKSVYDVCRQLSVAVFFITGRKDPRDRAGTEDNLRRQGMGDYTRLILALPEENGMTTAARKTKARASVQSEEGYTIIANLGDQMTDLEGGYAERTFKLPNPFYTIP